jgi:hypothetical protein
MQVPKVVDGADTYWRVLVADRDPEGKHPPPWYRRACNELFEKRKHADLDTVQLLRSEEDKGSSISSLTAKFLRRVQTTVWSRRLVILKNDCIGLVPRDTIETDTICILFGCDVPVVLRKHDDGNNWKVIGEAFIHGHGIMGGDSISRATGYEWEFSLNVRDVKTIELPFAVLSQ